MTNLGNLRYRAGDTGEARRLYERALEHDPAQAEARYNLGNLLEDLGETELAIAELRRVTLAAPEFADAHYNLGLLLARVGGIKQAQQHLERYVELDPRSEWADRARGFLGEIAA
jgi:tetratricopeptide (TPR) repeat protein